MSSPSSEQMSSSQTRFLYWFSGLLPIVTSVITPLTAYWSLTRRPGTAVSRYNDVLHEVTRQFVSGHIGLISYFGGAAIVRSSMERNRENRFASWSPAEKDTAMIVGGGLVSVLGYAGLRPLLSTNLHHFFQKNEVGVTKSRLHNPEMSGIKKGLLDLLDKRFMQGSVPIPGRLAIYSSLLLGVAFSATAALLGGALPRLLKKKPVEPIGFSLFSPPLAAPMTPASPLWAANLARPMPFQAFGAEFPRSANQDVFAFNAKPEPYAASPFQASLPQKPAVFSPTTSARPQPLRLQGFAGRTVI